MIDKFLSQYEHKTEDIAIWADGAIKLRFRSYPNPVLPPIDLITSVRCVIKRDDEVLLCRNPDVTHILPGGKREQGESLSETLKRELLEETGWTVKQTRLLGFTHFHHLKPQPAMYKYPYPDFFNIIYTGIADSYHENQILEDDFEIESAFQPVSYIEAIGLPKSERLFLKLALNE